MRFLPGDLLGVVVAEYLRADAAAVPISANDAVERRLKERKIILEKTKIGSPYVVAALDDLRGTGKHLRIVGWEANGGFLTGSDIELNGGVLAALPTRDALLPILANLCAAAEPGFEFGGAVGPLAGAFWPGRLARQFPGGGEPGDSCAIGSRRRCRRSRVRWRRRCCRLQSRRWESEWRLRHRPVKNWQHCQATLSRYFTPASGFDDIARINVLDGVRIYFRNGDIAHIRPSGNAPQLRIYAVSDTQARADQLSNSALREPDGILRQLERAFT